MKNTLPLLIICYFGYLQSSFSQSIINIPGDFSTIQQGLNNATVNTTILVKPGIYYEKLTWPSEIDGIKLIGVEGSANTIIDGTNSGRVILIEGEYTFDDEPQTITNLTVLQGFTIRNGNVSDGGAAGLICSEASPTLNDLIITDNACKGQNCSGGGAYLESFFGTVENCTFKNNRIETTSRAHGAGLNIRSLKNTVIKNCLFENNHSITQDWCYGGGLYLTGDPSTFNPIPEPIIFEINNCKFINNSTKTGRWSFGAGLYVENFFSETNDSVIIESCFFSKNNANVATWSHGAAIYTEYNNVLIHNSQFYQNAAESGAGVYISTNNINGPGTNAIIENSTFTKNIALTGNTAGGSAVYAGYDPLNLTMTNVLIYDNQSSALTFGIYESGGMIDLNHCTIYNNEKSQIFGENQVKAQNTVFWNKTVKEFPTHNPDLQLNNCIVKGGYSGPGNLNQHPLFVSDEVLLPTNGSPCLSAGILLPEVDKDISGNPRPMPANSVPDIGAYEMDQYFAHIWVKYYYDKNQNGKKESDERFISFGSVTDHRGNTYLNFTDFGNFIILDQGFASIKYENDIASEWQLSGVGYFEFDVNSEQFSENVEIGLYPTEIQSQLLTTVFGENFRCGEEINFTLTLTNYGTVIESGNYWLKIDERLKSFTFSKTPDHIISENEFSWVFQDLYPGESIVITFTVTAPLINSPGELGAIYAFCHGISEEASRENDCYYAELRCSFDPNDKISLPQRSDKLVLIEEPLPFIIRFQNTGNDFARHVVIKDKIDPNFDLRTLKILSSSHPEKMEVTYNESREVVFSFKNIILPDSTTNYEGSNGYVMYSLKYNENIEPHTTVENTADIYFDFNPAIITNTTENIVVYEFPTSTHESPEDKIIIYPNPSTNYISFSKNIDRSILFDMTGKRIVESFNKEGLSLDYPNGVYLLILESEEKASKHIVKIVR